MKIKIPEKAWKQYCKKCIPSPDFQRFDARCLLDDEDILACGNLEELILTTAEKEEREKINLNY